MSFATENQHYVGYSNLYLVGFDADQFVCFFGGEFAKWTFFCDKIRYNANASDR